MKNTEILNKNNNEIDWDAPMWVTSNHGILILTTGESNELYFTGTCLPCEGFPNGKYSQQWMKSTFRPMEVSLEIKISN